MKKSNVYLSAKWKSKRLQVLKRDKFTCLNCGSNKNLQCHHSYYVSGRLIHEYPNESLSTLCEKCHSEIHKKTKGIDLAITDFKLIANKIKEELNLSFDISELIELRNQISVNYFLHGF